MNSPKTFYVRHLSVWSLDRPMVKIFARRGWFKVHFYIFEKIEEDYYHLLNKDVTVKLVLRRKTPGYGYMT